MKHTVHEHKLASGAEGLIIHVPGSAVASVRIAFHSGFQFGKRSIYEVPHVMEHLLATVTKRHAQPNAFMIEAQKNGAYVNASTSTDTNEYIYECAAFELERMLDLIEEQVCEPLFAPEPFTAEVSNVREELIRNTTQHMAVCSLKLSERVFPQLWLGYDERIAQLDSLKLEQLEEHYHRTHTAANARFYLAGDFPDGGAAVAERFERTFARLPKGHRLPLDHAMGRGLERPVVTRRDIDQVYYRTGRYFGEIAPDQLPVLSLYNVLLVGGMASRVLGEARRRGLAYSVGTSAYAQRGNSGFGFAGYVTPDHAADLFEVMTRHVQALADGECTTEELSAAKDLLVGSIARSTQTAGDILGWYTERYDEEGEIRDFDQTLEQLRGVTGEEIAALGRVISDSNHRGMSFLGRLSEATVESYAKALGL